MQEYGIDIGPIFSSPAHNYFTREKFHIGDAPDIMHEELVLEAGRGIVGDRFETSKYPLTFFAAEVIDVVAEAHQTTIDLALFRRNIITRGVYLNDLIAEQFAIGDVVFEGVSYCAPCVWMNAAIGEGTYKLMEGRGGLRAKVVQGGVLTCGSQVLHSEKVLHHDPTASLAVTRPLP